MRMLIGLNSLLVVLLLTGCWDQERLVDKALIDGISLDKGKGDTITGTIRFLRLQNKGGGQFEAKDELVKAEGESITEIGRKLNMMMPGKLDATKTHIIIIGEDLAKTNISPLLEPIFRVQKSYLGGYLIITKGKASDIISIEAEVSPIAFDIIEMIQSGIIASGIPDRNLFTTWSYMIDPGKDMVLPYIERIQNDKLTIAGTALFNGDKFSGIYLPQKQSTLLLLLMDKLNKLTQLDVKIRQKNGKEKVVSVQVTDSKRKVDTRIDDKNKRIIYSMDYKLKVKVTNYPQNIIKPIDVKALNKKVGDQLTKDAKKVTKILQKANSDVLGIGRSVASKYPKLWKDMKWKEEYQNIKIEPTIEVEIINTGTLY